MDEIPLDTFQAEFETPVLDAIKRFYEHANRLSLEDRERALDRLALSIDGLCASECGQMFNPISHPEDYRQCIDECMARPDGS